MREEGNLDDIKVRGHILELLNQIKNDATNLSDKELIYFIDMCIIKVVEAQHIAIELKDKIGRDENRRCYTTNDDRIQISLK